MTVDFFSSPFAKILLSLSFLALVAEPACAGLRAVSGVQAGDRLTSVAADGSPKMAAVSLANGFPLWYEDRAGVRLTQCLDTNVAVAGGTVVDPCAPLLVNPQFPPSLANLAEVLYWQAEAAFNFDSRQDGIVMPGGFALLVLALEGGGANEGGVIDGNQAVFSRIRLRIDVPVAGTYRVTHPFGSFTYEITDPARRAIDQTQDVGVADAQNFLAAMRDRNIDFGNPDNLPIGFRPDFDDNGPVVNLDGAGIGPFLVPALPFSTGTLVGGPLTAVGGMRYLGLPFTPTGVPIDQPVVGSAFTPVPGGDNVPADFFRIELLDPPAGFELNAGGADPQVLQTRNFQVVGKLFNAGLNRAPTAPPVTVGILKGRSAIDIDVFAGRDIDVLDPRSEDLINGANVHGIDPQAIALADPAGDVFRDPASGMPLLTQPQALSSGATVRRVTRPSTGQSLFRYTVPQGVAAPFSDTFHYVVQDTGGLISNPAAVTVVVEDLRLERADYRVKTGKWHIGGTTDQRQGNVVTLFAAPRARLTGGGVALPGVSQLTGTVELLPRQTAGNAESIDYRLIIKGLPQPQDNNLEVSLHVDGPGQPAMFRLCSTPNRFIFPFPPPCSATDGVLDLTAHLIDFDLLPAAAGAGILTFTDAVDASLAGNAYVIVRTTANPDGAMRGPLLSQQVAVVQVDADGKWEFRGRAPILPGLLPGITARSVFGTRAYGPTLRLR